MSIEELNHGDLPRWLEAMDSLPDTAPTYVSLGDTVTIGDGQEIDDHDVFERRTFLAYLKVAVAIFAFKFDVQVSEFFVVIDFFGDYENAVVPKPVADIP